MRGGGKSPLPPFDPLMAFSSLPESQGGLDFLHTIACTYEINAPIFGGHWESMHLKWAHLNSNAARPRAQ